MSCVRFFNPERWTLNLTTYNSPKQRKDNPEQNTLYYPADEANADRPPGALVIKGLSDSDDHGNQHPDSAYNKDDGSQQRNNPQYTQHARRTWKTDRS